MGSNGEADTDLYDLYFAQINQQAYPWLTGILRYEQANPNTLESVANIVPHISALLVANVKVKIETRLNPDDIKFDNLFVGIDFAF